MSPRARVYGIVGVAAVAAAVAVVGATLLQTRGERAAEAPQVRAGAPRLLLDLGIRSDAEGRALRRAATLYDRGRRRDALAIFSRYRSVDARIGAAFARWPDGTLGTMEDLAGDTPRSAVVQLHLGLALYWSRRDGDALAAWRIAARVQPDTESAIEADTLLHPRFAPGLPPFVPEFPFPRRLARLPRDRQLAALAAAARAPDARAKLLYGIALQGLGRRVSAAAEFTAAARLAPDDPEARVADAVGRFSKTAPQRAFSRLGPLVRVFPRAQTVRFHLGLLLLWSGEVRQARKELVLARALGARTPLGREANAFLASLRSNGTK